jgi:ribose/xylose/arabinose/galactoside ABC-type transport system permease subunit
MPDIASIVEIIQLMLAPGLMISACGLLLLGMNNKYSLIVNRIRLLNEERRKVLRKIDDPEFSYQENIRFESISTQLAKLAYRVKLVRNAVLSYTIAVALFVITSLLIGFGYLFDITRLNSFITTLFLLGMVSVLCGVIFAAYETYKGYEIVKFEVEIEE